MPARMTEEERGDGLLPGMVCVSALHTLPHTIVQCGGVAAGQGMPAQDTYINDARVFLFLA